MANSWSICALSINADASKRQDRLKGDKLASGLEELVKAAQAEAQAEAKQKLSILTISELGHIEEGKKLAEKLKWKCFVENLKGSDKILTAYDNTVWEALDNEIHISAEGRYLALKLKMKESDMKLLYFSVHLPHKSGKENAYKLLSDAIDELGKDVDCVMIGGDWNMTPSEIQQKIKAKNFQQPAVALRETDGGTSAADRPIDNFALLSKQLQMEWQATFRANKKIMREIKVQVNGVDEIRNANEYTTHAPIWAEANFRKLVPEATAKAKKTVARETPENRTEATSGKGNFKSAKKATSGKEKSVNSVKKASEDGRNSRES